MEDRGCAIDRQTFQIQRRNSNYTLRGSGSSGQKHFSYGKIIAGDSVPVFGLDRLSPCYDLYIAGAWGLAMPAAPAFPRCRIQNVIGRYICK